MTDDLLPPVPVDDLTLDAIEHALGAALTFEDENGEPLDAPRVVGADYSLSALLDFLGGTMGDDPNQEVIEPGIMPDDPPRWVYDTRPSYSEKDLIRALIAEVRRLRETR